jgi:hypothetical protein
MILQKLVGDIFSVFIEILLWVIPVACASVPAFFLEGLTLVIPAMIGGFIAGIIVDVYFLGPIVVFLNIRSSLKNIENK